MVTNNTPSILDLKDNLVATLKNRPEPVNSLKKLILTALKTGGEGIDSGTISSVLKDLIAGQDGVLGTNDDLLPMKTLLSLKSAITNGTLEDLVTAISAHRWTRFLCCCSIENCNIDVSAI